MPRRPPPLRRAALWQQVCPSDRFAGVHRGLARSMSLHPCPTSGRQCNGLRCQCNALQPAGALPPRLAPPRVLDRCCCWASASAAVYGASVHAVRLSTAPARASRHGRPWPAQQRRPRGRGAAPPTAPACAAACAPAGVWAQALGGCGQRGSAVAVWMLRSVADSSLKEQQRDRSVLMQPAAPPFHGSSPPAAGARPGDATPPDPPRLLAAGVCQIASWRRWHRPPACRLHSGWGAKQLSRWQLPGKGRTLGAWNSLPLPRGRAWPAGHAPYCVPPCFEGSAAQLPPACPAPAAAVAAAGLPRRPLCTPDSVQHSRPGRLF